MDVIVKGKGKVSLTKRNFVQAGGQGKVFARGKIAYKIYDDPKTGMIPFAKIQELSVITHPAIIRPQKLLQDNAGNAIGYTMDYVKDAYPLCKLFTKTFKLRHDIKPRIVLDITQKIQDGVSHVHNCKILIVDLNELNFLVDKNFQNVFFIDVDSYQTHSFPATFIMPSIRDHHTKLFTELTDWFSFAVVTFQMWMGIHPYKGKHKSVKDLDARMEKNLSVFNTDVSIPSICPPIDIIPLGYRNWYKAVLEEGKRLLPPGGPQAIITVISAPKIITGSNNFNFIQIVEYDSDILSHQWINGTRILLREDCSHVGTRHCPKFSADSSVGMTPISGRVVIGNIKNRMIFINDLLYHSQIGSGFSAESAMTCDGRIYFKHGDLFNEVVFVETPNKIDVTYKQVANVMERATNVFDGVVIQDLLGAWYASVFPKSGEHRQIHLKDLKGKKIVDAKYDNLVLMVIVSEKGQYDKYIFRIANDYNSYDMRVISDLQYNGLNFIVLDNGICIHIVSDGNLEMFHNKSNNTEMKLFEDSSISTDMVLVKEGIKAMFIRGNKLYRITIK